MKIFYSLDCCCRVVVLVVILPLKLSWITFGLKPSWLLQSFGLIQPAALLSKKTTSIKRSEFDCFLVDNIEFGLNCGVVLFVMLEYWVRYKLIYLFQCLIIKVYSVLRSRCTDSRIQCSFFQVLCSKV